jgi:hypothetical protein
MKNAVEKLLGLIEGVVEDRISILNDEKSAAICLDANDQISDLECQIGHFEHIRNEAREIAARFIEDKSQCEKSS